MKIPFQISTETALTELSKVDQKFKELFAHGSLSVEIYKPEDVDTQTPHDRDEVYVVISGMGKFMRDKEMIEFKAGDFLFVPAGMEHRFINFTSDFSTWVFFYGPKGGEQ